MSDHEHDEDGNCIEPEQVVYQLPTWRFSLWDVAGIVLTTVGGFFGVTNQGLNLLARELTAMANWNRQNYDLRQAQRQYAQHQQAMAADLARLVDGPSSGDES